MSIVLFLLLATFDTYYIKVLLNEYSGNRNEVYTAQTRIAGHPIYLILGITLILNENGQE